MKRPVQFPTHKRFGAGDRIRWAFDQGREHDLKAPARATLNALAFYANQRSLEAWPSVGTIAGDIGYSRETVHRALKALERTGLIRRVMRNTRGGRSSNSYILNIERPQEPAKAQSERLKAAEAASIAAANRTLGLVDNPVDNPEAHVSERHLGCVTVTHGLDPVDNPEKQDGKRARGPKTPRAHVSERHTEQNTKYNSASPPRTEGAWLALMTPVDDDDE